MARAETPLSLMISLIVILIVSMSCVVLGLLPRSAPAAEAEKYLLDVCKETYSNDNKVMKYCVEPLKPYVAQIVADGYKDVYIGSLAAQAVELAIDICKKALVMNKTHGRQELVKDHGQEDKLCIDSFKHQNDTLQEFPWDILMPAPDATGPVSPKFQLRIVSPWKQLEKKCVTASFQKVAEEYTNAIHVAYVVIKLYDNLPHDR